MLYDKYNRPYVTTIKEANNYRILDRSPNWAAISGWQVYQKWVKLYYKVDKNLYLLPPKYRRVKNFVNDNPIQQKQEIFELREGQKKSVECVMDNLSKNAYSILIDSMVGTGKTVQMLGIVSKYKCKTIITAPSKAICIGIKNTFDPYFDVDVLDWSEIRKRHKQWKLPDIIVCHRQSAVNCWDIINNWEYHLLLNDEQHHLSDWMKNICNTFKGGLWIVWFTGTPFRKEMNKNDFYNYFNIIYDTGLKSLGVKILTYKYTCNYWLEEFMKASEWLSPESPEVYRRLFANNEDRNNELLKLVRYLYFNRWFKRMMIFVDRRESLEKINELFPKAYVIHWDVDKEEVINKVKPLDEFLLIWMVTASWEWFDVPSIQCWVLFYSTSREWSLIQMMWRTQRFSWDKKFWYWVDFQDYSKIEPNKYIKSFWAKERIKLYNSLWYDIEVLPKLF